MIDLSKISKVAIDAGLTVTSQHLDIPFNYISEIDYDELVDVYTLQRPLEIGFEPGLSCMIVKRKNGDVYLLGILESSRYEDAWRFLDHDTYAYYVNNILPLYNIAITDNYVRTPVVARSSDSEAPAHEFFYCLKIQFPDIDDERIEDNILLTSIGDMIYNVAIFRSLLNAHYDLALNKWYDDLKFCASINGSRSNIREINNDVILAEHMAYGINYAHYNGRIYVAISALPLPDEMRHRITDLDRQRNMESAKVFIDHFRRMGLDMNVCILSELCSGPLKTIGKLLMKYMGGEHYERYDLLTIELTPLTERIGISQIMAHYLNVATTESFQRINVSAQKMWHVADEHIPKVAPVNKVKPVITKESDLVTTSDFYMSTVKVS